MFKKLAIFVIGGLLLVGTPVFAYTINNGDTLSFLSSKFNTTVDYLMSINPQIKDKNLIVAGEELNTEARLGATPKRPTEFRSSLGEQKTEGHSDTTLKVTSITTKDGNTLDPTVMGDLIVLSINSGASNSETATCTDLVTSTKTFTGCIFGYRFDNPTATSSSNIKAHSPGELVIISNTDTYLSQQYLTLDGDQTITGDDTVNGIWTFSNSSIPRLSAEHTYGAGEEQYFATYRLVASTSYSGTVDGNTTTKGIYEQATDDEFTANTATGTTGAQLVPSISSITSHKSDHWNTAVEYGEYLSAGDVVYINPSDGKYYRASATNTTHIANIAGVAYTAGFAGSFGKVNMQGSVQYHGSNGGGCADFTNTAGKTVYLDDTAGSICAASGTYTKVIGKMISATAWIFNPNVLQETATPTAGAIPIWQSNGQLSVSSTPVTSTDATSKGYVDTTSQIFYGASASDDLVQSADTERTKANSESYSIVKEIQTNVSGEFRIKFDIKGDSADNSNAARIYKNGVAFGSVQTATAGSTYATKSEDLNFAVGDLIQLYYRTKVSENCYVKNFRVYFETVEVDKTVVNTD